MSINLEKALKLLLPISLIMILASSLVGSVSLPRLVDANVVCCDTVEVPRKFDVVGSGLYINRLEVAEFLRGVVKGPREIQEPRAR